MVKQPRVIFWEVTKHCNLKCAYCRRLKNTPLSELNTNEAFELIADIKNSFPDVLLILSGGEPLLRKDLFEILSYAHDMELKVALATNGTLLNEENAGELKKAGIRRISISLDSVREKMHDASRGISGSYRKALNACGILQGCNIPFQINVTVAKANKDEVRSIAERALALGAVAVHYFILVPVGCGMELERSEMLNVFETEEVLSRIKDISCDLRLEIRPTCAPQYIRFIDKKTHGGCLAGSGVFFISCEGYVYPCGYLPVKAGSLREKNVKDIWENCAVFADLRRNNLKGACSVCLYKDNCRGCRARAYSQSGDYMAADTSCMTMREAVIA